MILFTLPCGRVVVNIRNRETLPKNQKLIFMAGHIVMFPVWRYSPIHKAAGSLVTSRSLQNGKMSMGNCRTERPPDPILYGGRLSGGFVNSAVKTRVPWAHGKNLSCYQHYHVSRHVDWRFPSISAQVHIQVGPPLTLGFEVPKLSIFGPYLIFP